MWVDWVVRTGSAPFSFSLYGYRLAAGYFCVVKGRGEIYPIYVNLKVTDRKVDQKYDRNRKPHQYEVGDTVVY
jgi:hypothetical protein